LICFSVTGSSRQVRRVFLPFGAFFITDPASPQRVDRCVWGTTGDLPDHRPKKRLIVSAGRLAVNLWTYFLRTLSAGPDRKLAKVSAGGSKPPGTMWNARASADTWPFAKGRFRRLVMRANGPSNRSPKAPARVAVS
jgi:hypothetical protein